MWGVPSPCRCAGAQNAPPHASAGFANRVLCSSFLRRGSSRRSSASFASARRVCLGGLLLCVSVLNGQPMGSQILYHGEPKGGLRLFAGEACWSWERCFPPRLLSHCPFFHLTESSYADLFGSKPSASKETTPEQFSMGCSGFDESNGFATTETPYRADLAAHFFPLMER